MWTERALAMAVDTHRPVHVAALNSLGFLAEDQNQLDAAHDVFSRAFAIGGEIGDVLGQAKAAGGLGIVAHDQGAYDLALEWHQRAADLANSVGQRRTYVMALANMGTVAYYQTNYDLTEEWWEACRPILRELGDLNTEGMLVSNLAALATERNQLDRAEQLLMETLQLQRETNDSRSIAFTLTNLGELWMRRRDFARAHACFSEALASFRQAGDRRNSAITNVNFAELLMSFGQEDQAAALLGQSALDLYEIRDQLSLAESFERLATLAARQRRHTEAAELFGVVEGMRVQLGAPPRPSVEAEIVEARSLAERGLGSDRFAELLAIGRGRSTGDAVLRARAIATVVGSVPATGREWNAEAAISAAAASPHHASERFREIAVVDPVPVTMEPIAGNPLTAREMDVLRLLAEGHSSPDIARALFISPRTATTHVANIREKLGVGSRAAAVASAMRMGIL
jgi:DNA-binding CsgD family transcriptional regulator/tetratricopeptide (TPR) repeat protein